MIRLSTNSFSWNTTYNKGVDELGPFDLCRQAADCGAEGVEIDPASITAEQLADCGIALSGGSTGGPLYDNWTDADADKVVATAAGVKAMGGQYVFFTAAPKGGWGAHEPVTADDLGLAGARFNALASRVAAEGVALGLHNHAACQDGLAAELALVRDHVDPALVGLYLDIGWAFCSDGDPAAIIREFGARCMGFHFRNHTADKVPTETLSEGVLDIPTIVSAITATGYAGWVALELWHRDDVPVTKTMAECQTESLSCLRTLFAGA
jgi:sugar phosphate isomerase/epimerase